MKKFSMWTAAIAAVGMFVAAYTASAQNNGAGASAQATTGPHQIGLIDMAHIFKNYDKFKKQTESLQQAAEEAEGKAQTILERMKKLQQQAQTLTPGSPEYNQLEGEMIQEQAKLQALKQSEQREIVRKQAEVYKQIYLEVQDAVTQYAKHYEYTLVIRFNRQDVAEASDPDNIIQSMNRQVVYYQSQDDVTEPILNYLNDRYKRSASN